MKNIDQVIQELKAVIEEATYPDRPRQFMIPLELAESALVLLKAQEPRVVLKREISSLPKGAVIWVETRDTIDDYKLDVECYQGVREHINLYTGDYELYIEYLCGQDTVAEYGKEYRFWTQRPTWDDMVNTKWEVKNR